MAHTLFPHADPSQTYNHDAHLILDEMIAKGNRLAAVRKSELSHLEMLFGELAARIERRGLQTLTLSSLDNEIVDSSTEQQQQQLTTSTPGDEPIPFTVPTESDLPQTPRDLEILDSIGISSDEFFSIVNQMGNPENWSMLDPAAVP